jgi:hypothetical protein
MDTGQLHMLAVEHLGLMGVMHRPGARRDVGGAGALDAASQRGPHQKGERSKGDQNAGTGHEG